MPNFETITINCTGFRSQTHYLLIKLATSAVKFGLRRHGLHPITLPLLAHF